MTAITEITRNGSRSARGLVSIQSRLNQVVDESSSTGKQLIELYKEQNIALFDQNGQLRDSYDILKDLAAVWPTLTRNQQAEFALAQAGANQTQNFTALMNNFQVAIDATATAMDSAGSAMKENTSYMESLEAQTTQLKATFQDFANNVIDKELVSSALKGLNTALEVLNTPIGKAVTQWTLLTGVLTGGLTIYGQIAGKLIGTAKAGLTFASAITGAGTAASGAAVGFGTLAATALPIAAAIGAIAVAGWKVYEWYKDTHKSLQEYTDEVKANNKQLEQNKYRIEEINNLPWKDKTPEIMAEKEALEKENEELQKQIDKLEKLSVKSAKRTLQGGYVESTQYKVSSSSSFGLGADTYLSEATFDTYDELVQYLNNYIPGASKKTREELEAMGIVFEEVTGEVYKTGDAYEQSLIQKANELSTKLQGNHKLTEQELQDYQDITSKLGDVAEAHKYLGDNSNNAYNALNQLTSSYQDAIEYTDKYSNSVEISIAQVDAFKARCPELADQIVYVNGKYLLLSNSASSAANSLMSADGRIKKSSKDRTQSVLKDLQNLIDAYYSVVSTFAKAGTSSGITATQAKEANELARSLDAKKKQIQAAIYRSEKNGYYDDTKDSSSLAPSKTSSTKAKQTTDDALKAFNNYYKDLQHQREIDEIDDATYYKKLEGLVAQYKANATAHMKEYGLNVDTINRNMYQYEEEIYKGRAKLADELKEQQKKDAEEAAQAQKEAAEEAAQAQKEALEKQKEDFETAVNYVIKQIDEEISKLQDLRDQTEQYYDDKIDAVNKANDALEDQIHYEELLNNLAKAKDKQLYVFQNGQFQYVQDVEAIASAQAELDAYERDKALQDEVKNLETLKEQALASIDEQIEGWEKYKEQWESVTTQYQEQQDKLLAEQLFGIDAEQENWETRLANVQSFVDQYNSILSQLNSGIGETSSGSAGGGSSTGGRYYFDSSKGNGGWTEQELLESNPEYFQNGGTSASKSSSSNNSLNNPWQSAYDSYVAKGDYKSASQVIEEAESRGQTVSKHAVGTLSAPGGLSLVGEYGPELRVLNSGDGIIPADATRNLWDWAAYSPKDFMGRMGSDNIFHIGNIALPNVTDAKSFVNGLKQLAYQRAYKRA